MTWILPNIGVNKNPKSASELDQLPTIPIAIGNVGDTTSNTIGSYYRRSSNIADYSTKENDIEDTANDIGSSTSSNIADRRFSGFGVSSPWGGGGAFGQYGNKFPSWRRKKRQTLPESPLFSKIWPTLYTNGKVTFGTNWKNNIFGLGFKQWEPATDPEAPNPTLGSALGFIMTLASLSLLASAPEIGILVIIISNYDHN